MHKLDLQQLLDIDELSIDQKKSLDGLVSYEFQDMKTHIDLVFSVSSDHHSRARYTVKDNSLDETFYKCMMDYLILAKLKYSLKDPQTIDLVKEMIASFPRLQSNYKERSILINTEVCKVPDHMVFKSQDLYTLLMIIKDKG